MAKNKEKEVIVENEVWIKPVRMSDNYTVIQVYKVKPKDNGFTKNTVKPETYKKLFENKNPK